MIIRDGNSSAFTLVSADHEFELSLQLTDELCGEFRAHLAAHGFGLPEDDARAISREVTVATAANPAAWTAAGATIVAFLHRHRGKAHRFEVEGESVSVEGYSARHVKRLAIHLAGLSRERGSRKWQPETGPDNRR